MEYTDVLGKWLSLEGRRRLRRNRKVGEERIEAITVTTIETGLFAKTSHCKVAQSRFSGPGDVVLEYLYQAYTRVKEVPIKGMKVPNMEKTTLLHTSCHNHN